MKSSHEGPTLAKKSNWTFRDPIGSIWNPIGPGLAQLDYIISNWTFDRSNWTRGSFNRTPKSPIGSIILLDNVNWIKMNHGSRTFRNRYAVAILLLYFHFSIFTTSGKCVERLVLRTRRSPARGPPKTSKRWPISNLYDMISHFYAWSLVLNRLSMSWPRFLQIRLGNESCDQISASSNGSKRAKSYESRDKNTYTLRRRPRKFIYLCPDSEFNQINR